jgi:hypothetical protein
MSINFDLQANGWIDDGTESGAIRTDRKSMVVIPIDSSVILASVGANINTYNSLSGVENSNGSVVSVQITQGTGNFAQIKIPFRGTMFGIARRSSDKFGYTVMIDGVAYKAGTANEGIIQPVEWASRVQFSDNQYVEMISTNLPDTFHEAEIIIQGVASDPLNFNLYGIGVSRDAGYKEPLPSIWRVMNVPLPSTLTDILTLDQTPIRSVGKFCFYNSSVSAVTVTVSYGGSTPVFVQSVPPTSTIEWNFSNPMAIDTSLYQVSASVASVVKMTLFGRTNL